MSKPSPVRTVRVGETKVLTNQRRHRSFSDPYHMVLNLSWPRFFAGLVLVFILVNLLFGVAYWLLPGSVANARESNFLDYFFFSIETLATVGYGNMSPASLMGHTVASMEILLGMVGVAITTGLVFVRFSKPTARILFSDNAIIRDFDGARFLMLRMANERHNRIVEASATVSFIRLEINRQGESFIKIHDLSLVRQRTPVFALTWSLMHKIDERSPLFGLDREQLAAAQCRILVSVTGHDETVAASVYAEKSYEAQDVAFDCRFVDILQVTPDGDRIVDMTRFHDLEKPHDQSRGVSP
jgi:inward rectifier potassium channel